jgi:hypothetical protein
METPRGLPGLVPLVGFILTGFILLTRCTNPLQAPGLVSPEPGAGQVLITIDAGAERTAFPRLDQFSKIMLTFQRKDGAGTMSPVEVSLGETIISLSPGTWEVTASAYNNAEPPAVAARAVNTLTRTGDLITGDTHFALAPAGTGPGILRYTISPPSGIALDPAQSRIRIERDGAVLAALNTGGFNAGTRPITGAVNGGVVNLDPGRYALDMVLDDAGSLNTAVYREAVVILPGLVTEITFAPQTGDFLDPAVRAALTSAAGVNFGRTPFNSSATAIGAAGGGELEKTQALSVPNNIGTVYFTLSKAANQTITLGGPAAGKLIMAESGIVDGRTASKTLAVFTVNTGDIAGPGGNLEFTLTLGETGRTPVLYRVTLTVAYVVELLIDEVPVKQVYRAGEALDLTGIRLIGTYSDGKTGAVTVSEADAAGFDSSQTGKQILQIVKYGVTAKREILPFVYEEGFPVTVTTSVQSELLFDPGWRNPAKPKDPNEPLPNRFSVVKGNTLALAPVKWLIPDNAVYEWKLDGVTQGSTTEYLSVSPAATGEYPVTVTARVNGSAIASASTTLVCVNPPSPRPTITGTSSEKSVKLYTYLAPGQFGEMDGGNLYGSGGYGGYTVFKFDHSIERKGIDGEELRVGGNAFAGWNEPGIIWVMRDENGNGQPDDTWYELEGSHAAIAVRRHSVKYLYSEGVWVDNLGGGENLSDKAAIETKVFTGTMLPREVCSLGAGQIWGYADVFDNGRLSLSNAVQMDGSPIALDFIDFVKIQTAVNYTDPIFGERSTEARLPMDRNMGDPDALVNGKSLGGDQYEYTLENMSGYDLTITLGGEEFILAKSSSGTTTVVKTLTGTPSAYVDYYGGNVTLQVYPGLARFSSAD